MPIMVRTPMYIIRMDGDRDKDNRVASVLPPPPLDTKLQSRFFDEVVQEPPPPARWTLPALNTTAPFLQCHPVALLLGLKEGAAQVASLELHKGGQGAGHGQALGVRATLEGSAQWWAHKKTTINYKGEREGGGIQWW